MPLSATSAHPTVSVVVPAHDAGPYLDACLESIASQTMQDLECIVVDDGSQDETGAIADAFAARDPRFKVIHQEQAGAAAARNAGIDHARGTFVGFVDADDRCLPSMYERLVERARATQAALVACDYLEWGGEGEPIARGAFDGFSESSLDEHNYWARFYEGDLLALIFVWNKLARKDALGGVRFTAGHANEDAHIALEAMRRVGRIELVREPLYVYLHRADSFSSTWWPARYLDLCETLIERAGYFRERGWEDLWDENALYLLARAARTWRGVEGCDDAVRERFAACQRTAKRWARELLRRRWREPRYVTRALPYLMGDRVYLWFVEARSRLRRG